MKRAEFLKRVVKMCGPVEVEAVHRLAELPPVRRRSAAQELGAEASDRGLSDFLMSLIEEDLVDDLAAILPGGTGRQSAEDLLTLLWTRLLSMIGPEAKDVLYAHNQLRLMVEKRSRHATTPDGSRVDEAYQSALENARAVLAATTDAEERAEDARQTPEGDPDQ